MTPLKTIWLSRAASLVATALLGAATVAFYPGSASADAQDVPDPRGVRRAEDPRGVRRAEDPRGDVVSQEIEVRLAEIEVVVSDRRGDPVAGLTRDDFRVFQDGRPVALTHFRAVNAPWAPLLGNGGRVAIAGEAASGVEPAAPLAAPSAAAPDPGLHLVVYVDRGYLEPGDLRDVRQALKGFLRQALAPGDQVMLVTAAQSLELEQGFTSVPELVVSKLDGIRARPGGGRLNREYQSILRDMQRVKNQGNDLMARDPASQARTYVSRIQAYAAQVEGEIRQTTAQLQQLVQSIAGLPGRRVVLYVGGRVPAASGRRLFGAWEDAFGRNSSLQNADSPDGAESGAGGGGAAASSSDTRLDALGAASAAFDLGAQRAVQDVAEAASAHGVVFHAIDAGGLRDSTFLAPSDATTSRGSPNPGTAIAAGSLADSMASLGALASATGGRSFTGGRDFTAALAHIGSDLRTYYSLGFEPLEPNGESSRIKVRLHQPASLRDDGTRRGKLEVRYRSVLKLKDLDTLAAERTVSALLLEKMDNPLRVEVSAGEPAAAEQGASPRRGASRTWRVPVSVTVPLARLALVADGRVHAGRLSIYTASGSLGRVTAVTKAVVPVRIPNRDLLTSLGRLLEYQLELTLPAGPIRIAVTVRDDFRPRSSTAVTTVGVEELAGAAGSEPGSR